SLPRALLRVTTRPRPVPQHRHTGTASDRWPVRLPAALTRAWRNCARSARTAVPPECRISAVELLWLAIPTIFRAGVSGWCVHARPLQRAVVRGRAWIGQLRDCGRSLMAPPLPRCPAAYHCQQEATPDPQRWRAGGHLLRADW